MLAATLATNPVVAAYLAAWAITLVLIFAHRASLRGSRLASYWPAWLLLPLMFFLAHEFFYATAGVECLYSANHRTALFYDLSSAYTHSFGIDPNYSEGYYPAGDFSVTPRQAEHAKFAHILEKLGVRRGDALLNLGCGTCSLELYCAERGISVVALTLSSEATGFCLANGVEAYTWDYRLPNSALVGRFDGIVMMGSSEHMFSGSPLLARSYVRKRAQMREVFQIIRPYFREERRGPQRVFFSELHVNPRPRFYRSAANYVLERAYGGTLTMDTRGTSAVTAAEEVGYEVVYTRDATEDYYMATALNEDHFGTPNRPLSVASLGLLATGVVVPHMWYLYLYGILGLWMWMFDGRLHFHWNKRYSLRDRADRPCTLWWNVLERRS
jgi:cyclopropane fatty-acyl-phospholipid synthase-like methyltransferase